MKGKISKKDMDYFDNGEFIINGTNTGICFLALVALMYKWFTEIVVEDYGVSAMPVIDMSFFTFVGRFVIMCLIIVIMYHLNGFILNYMAPFRYKYLLMKKGNKK